jgi:hypothetical protein
LETGRNVDVSSLVRILMVLGLEIAIRPQGRRPTLDDLLQEQ